MLPSEVTGDFQDPRYDDISALEQIDRIVVSMDFDLQSQIYRFVPADPNGGILFFHQGHRGDFHRSKALIGRFLREGYSVVAFCMPLLGLNEPVSVELPGIGRVKVATHDHMEYLTPASGHPIRYFVEPVVVALNWLEANEEFSGVSMVGISGGGWTTTLAAAVDPRIARSFPVAGSYPIFLRAREVRDWGDFEQHCPALYRTANHLELYLLGAHGEGRTQVQIFNRYDSCCFGGLKSRVYEDVVKSRLSSLGAGSFDLLVDESHQEHQISPVGMEWILDRSKDGGAE